MKNSRLLAVVAAFLIAFAHSSASAFCFAEASARYGVPQWLLEVIAEVESSNNPKAIGQNTNGTQDIGLMQINSWWLPKLAKHGITRQDLFNPCTSVNVGAWILAENFKRHGMVWKAVGAYNAVTPAKQEIYVGKVWRKARKRGFEL